MSSNPLGVRRDADLAVLRDGSFVAVWEGLSQDGDGSGIFARRFNGGGRLPGPEVQVNSHASGRRDGPEVRVNLEIAGDVFGADPVIGSGTNVGPT